MNSWSSEHFIMPNMMAVPPMMSNMMQAPVAPMIGMTADMNSQVSLPGPKNTPADDEIQNNDVDSNTNARSTDRGSRSDRKDRDRGRRPRSRDRYDRSDRNRERDRRDRSRSNKERHSKWDKTSTAPALGNMIMPAGNIMPYGNMMNMMPQQMEMSGMPHMPNMMSNMMPGMNIMPHMMEHNMMMNHQMSFMPNQHLFVTNAVLLPPVPGTSLPSRRERPPGCCTIFVGGLPAVITSELLQEIFQRFGSISDIKVHNKGFCHIRFDKEESVEQSFALSGYRFKYHDQTDSEATSFIIDYALNRSDQSEHDRSKHVATPPRIEQFNSGTLAALTDNIKSEDKFAEAAPTLAGWLERGECNKRNANAFYSLVQVSNNQIRRLFNEKMQLEEEFQAVKSNIKEKFGHVLLQFEQVAKILSAAKHQRVSDHFSKQQRRNIEMWLKMTEEVDNMREEYNANFDDEESEKMLRDTALLEKYEELKRENDNLMCELEGYKNEAHLAKEEAERKFEKFKAHYIAQQALQNNQLFPPLPSPPVPNVTMTPPMAALLPDMPNKPEPLPPKLEQKKPNTSVSNVSLSEAKLISILTAFLMVHPLGVSLDYLVSYVRSMIPSVTQVAVHQILQNYTEVFQCTTSGVGACIENKWKFVIFDVIKKEA